jgi:arylsulfatase A-like enzyme
VPLVLFPLERTGLPAEEVTIADVLGERGYATCCVGKSHLGTEPPFHPTRHGFDAWYGLPYSNDMMAWDGVEPFRAQHALRELPLFDCRAPTETAAEAPADQTTLTRRYTQRAVEFIEANAEGPFFLYLAHTFPHSPQYASPAFDGRSRGGIYGDTVEELDWSVGQIVETLKRLGLEEDTLVFFTSDNGPAPGNPRRIVDGKPRYSGGSPGPLRGRKGLTWEGGMREPAIAWWPGRIAPGRETAYVASALDLLPTVASLAGASLPEDRVIDGADISGLLLENATGAPPERLFCYYFGTQLQAVRRGRWKLVLPIDEYPERPQSLWYLLIPELFERQHRLFPRSELYDLAVDIGETTDVAAQQPALVAELLAEAGRFDDALQADRRQQVWLAPPSVPATPTGAAGRPPSP